MNYQWNACDMKNLGRKKLTIKFHWKESSISPNINYLKDFKSSGTSVYQASSSGIRHQWLGVDAINN